MDVPLGPSFDAFGVPAVVTPPGAEAIETTAFWVSPTPDDYPDAADLVRREHQRVLVLRRDQVPSVPRGTVIEVAPYGSDVVARWRVDGFSRPEEDHLRVRLVPDPDGDT